MVQILLDRGLTLSSITNIYNRRCCEKSSSLSEIKDSLPKWFVLLQGVCNEYKMLNDISKFRPVRAVLLKDQIDITAIY